MAIAFATGLWADISPGAPDELALLQARNDFPQDHDRCHLAVGSSDFGPCLASGSTPRILLWGDSMADRWAPAMQDWTSKHSPLVPLDRLTKDGCPPLVGALPTAPATGTWAPYVTCRTFNEKVSERLRMAGAAGNSGVLLSAAWWLRATDSDLTKLGSTEPRHSFDVSAADADQSLSALERFMRSTLHQITANGLRAILVLDLPTLLNEQDGALDAPYCLLRRPESQCSVPLAMHRLRSDPVNRVLEKVAAEFPDDVEVLDPATLVCRNDACPSRIGQIVAYSDYEHLTAAMSHALSGSLAPYLEWLTADRPHRL